MKTVHKDIYFMIAIFLFSSWCSCERSTAPPMENQPPETYIANVPAENDTIFALVSLSWNGGDSDGFVAKYQYRYITYFLFQGDSLVQDWIETPQTSATITFISSDSMNRQKFQVRAIDNEGLVDPEPAEKIFYTPRAIAPITEIVSPTDGQEFFVLDNVTDWWRGIPLIFTGTDEDGEIVEFGYKVDNGSWNWTTDTSTVIPPDMFSPPLEGWHSISITARDNTDLLDTSEPSIAAQFIRPTFEKTLLILDETDEDNWPSGIDASDDSVDQFYRDLFGLQNPNQWDEWDYKAMGDAPTRDILGQYKLLIWHGDNRPTSAPHALANHVELFQDFANVGGDFILSGWRMIKSFAWQESFPRTFPPESFVNKYLHIVTADETPLGADFTHGIGVGGFTDIRVDTAKLDGIFPFFGSLAQVNVISNRGNFTNIICSYGTSDNTPYPQYRLMPCGVIYFGTSFNAAVLGFPLFFIEKMDAEVLARQILTSLNY